MKEHNTVFVFGSNLAGLHGAGSAREAYINRGAIMGRGYGLQGNSYAIPTKDHNLNVLPLSVIEKYIKDFVAFATINPYIQFDVVRIGCGLAGYKWEQIKPLFGELPKNVEFIQP